MEEEKKKKEEEEMDGKSKVKRVTRVLVVDDSSLDRKIVERLLQSSRFKFEVTTVDSGEKALEVLGNTEDMDESPHTVPMDGYQLLKTIKVDFHNQTQIFLSFSPVLPNPQENSCLSSIPVVIMSSENDSQRIIRCKAIGAEDFIIKPIRASHLQKLRSYAMPPEVPAPKSAGTKRKFPLDLEVITEGNDATWRRPPHFAGVDVA